MRIKRTTGLTFLFFALACLVPLGVAADELSGEGWVRARIAADRTLVINDAVYHVTARSVFRGIEGERIRFGDLEDVVRVDNAAHAPLRVATWARYDATEVRGRLVLNWLELSNEHEGADTGSGDAGGQPSPASARLQRGDGT